MFPLSPQDFYNFFGIKAKEGLRRGWFCWFSHCMVNLKYCFSDGCWFSQIFARFLPIERLHPTSKMWLVLIICLPIIISSYHLVSLHEKNRCHYLLTVSHCLRKYICKSFIWSLGSLPLFQVIYWNTNSTCACYHVTCYHLVHAVYVVMSQHAILELVDSVSNFFNMMFLICIRYLY